MEEESAPKRRRTSPRFSDDRASSQDAPDDPAPASSPRRRRPSFASPTKASMSRWNPEILERRISQSPPKTQPIPPRSPLRNPPRRSSVSAGVRGLSLSPVRVSRPPPDDTLPTAPEANSDEATQQNAEPPNEDQPGARGGLFAAPRRSLSRPIPRPLPASAPEGEADANPFAGRALRRSPPTGISIPPQPEPELPPSVPDPISSTPPKGIHSSPSKWRTRHKPTSSSPLKRPPTRPGENDAENTVSFAQNLRKPGLRRPRPSQAPLGERSTNIRGVPEFDINSEKKKERDSLRKELETLNRDLALVSRENNRIRVMLESGRVVSAADEGALLKLVKKHLAPDISEQLPSQSELLAKAALDPLALASLGKPARAIIPDSADEEEPESFISHRPIPMTANEELPFLQLFSPFRVTSRLTILPNVAGQALRQQLLVRLHSKESPDLFSSLLKLTIDALELQIISINIDSLEPAAVPELGLFLRDICQGDCNRSMQRNIGIMTWAMAEWLRISEQRARFWARLQRETRSKDAFLDMSRSARSRKPRRNKSSEVDDDEDDDDSITYSSAELLPFMGRTSFDIPIPLANVSTSCIRLSWNVEFDWTGEAQSKVSAMVSGPSIWHGADRKGAISKLPSLFERLIEGGEKPHVAVQKVVALLVGNGE